MPRSFKDVRHDLEGTLDDVARSLRTAAESLSGDAGEAASKTAADAMHAAELVRKYAAATAKKAAHQVHEHPIMSLAVVITAAAAMVGLIIVATREK